MIKAVGKKPPQVTLAVRIDAGDHQFASAVDSINGNRDSIAGYSIERTDSKIETCGGVMVRSTIGGHGSKPNRQVSGSPPANPIEFRGHARIELPGSAAPFHISVIGIHQRSVPIQNQLPIPP